MSTTLYELDYSLRLIDSLLSESQDEETTEILESAREQLVPQIEEKGLDIVTYIKDCANREEYLKKEAIRIAKKAKNLAVRQKFLKQLMIDHLKRTDRLSADYGTFTVALAKTPEKVVINEGEERWLPTDLCVVTRTPDKQAIKNAMVDGKLTVNIDGHDLVLAHLESDVTIRIK